MAENNDDDAWQQAIRGVKPLQHDKVYLPETANSDATTRRRQAAMAATSKQTTAASILTALPDVACFVRAGVQQKRWRKLQRGQLSIQARLDLHGCTLAQAEQQLTDFIQRARAQQQRCVLIIHGKGNIQQQTFAPLTQFVQQWLQTQQTVLAYCPAKPQHGGDGARYTLLSLK